MQMYEPKLRLFKGLYLRIMLA